MNSYSDKPTEQQGKLLRKDRERLAKRREIIDAARVVFSRHGYDNSTLDEIAVQAEFAKGTLYNYFDSKEALLVEIIDGMMTDIADIARSSEDGGESAEERLYSFALQSIAYYKANDDVMRLLMNEMGRIQTKERTTIIMARLRVVALILSEYLDCGARKKGIELHDALDLAFAFFGMIHNRMVRRIIQDDGLGRVDTVKEAKALTHLFFHGAAPVAF